MSKPKVILAGDVGGTKTYLGAFVRRGDSLEPVSEKRYANGEFTDVAGIIEEFVEAGGLGEIEAATLGIAGPVERNRSSLTNLGWDLDGDELGRRFRAERFELVNDLAATANGVDLLGPDDLCVLQEGKEREGNAVLIAAGTGLGEAMLFWDGKTHRPAASEGGHADFAPRGEVQRALLEHLSAIYGHVSYERVLSGPGLENIYNFLLKRRGREIPEGLRQRFGSVDDAAAVISDEAVKGGDEDCADALDLFVSVYGAEAGNLALKFLSLGGVYVGGGIVPQIIDLLGSGGFMEAFTDKGRFQELLSGIPVRVILNDRTALLGAAAHAASLTGAGEGIARIAAQGGA